MNHTCLLVPRLLLILVWVAGLGKLGISQAEITGWYAPSTAKILRDARPDPAAGQWELCAARQETEACQLILRSDQAVTNVQVSVSPWRGAGRPTPAGARLFKVAFVPNIVSNTPYPDPLPPLKPLALAPGQAQPVWISVRVPKDAAPGKYEATVRLEAEGRQQTFPLRLRVWDFTLPDTPACTTAFGLDAESIARQHGVAPGSAEARALYARYYEMLLDHRISAYTIPADLMSEQAARYLDDPRLTSYVIPYPANDEELKRLVARLVQRGWYAKGFFYPWDEPVKKEAYDAVQKISERLRQFAPGYHWTIPFYCRPDFDTKLTAYDLMTGKVNIWCPNSHYFDLEPKTRPYLAERRALGEKVWWYVCCGPGTPYNNFFVEMPAMSHRVLFWQQHRERVEGLLYWSSSYWNPASTRDPWQDMATVKDINPNIRGDGSLFYPGRPVGVDGPVSSLRLEVIRDGLEDFDYLALAEARLGRDTVQGYVKRIARTLSDYEQDPRALENVRRELGDLLEQKSKTLAVEANRCAELPFVSQTAYEDPFNAVQLDLLVTDPNGRRLRVPGFWAGGDQWRVRFASDVIGRHTYRTECSDTNNRGLHHLSGAIEVIPYRGEHPLYQHGFPRVAANGRTLEYADGTPFFWLGDTWWMGLCQRLRWPVEFQQLAADRKAKGFNVVQIVAGLYPDMPAFDPRGANEAGFPWETNYARIRPEYFAATDQRLKYLVEEGFVPCIVGAWGYFLPWMGVEKAKAHWRYLIARYGSWPVAWCVAGEANLPWYLARGFPYDDREQVQGWTEVTRYVRETDPFKRLVTIHPTAIRRYTARHAIDDPYLLDFDMLQTPHGQSEAVPVTVRAVRESYAASPVLPVINGEASYEMLLDSLPTEWTRRMFWICLMNGAAGHTYGANGIWQVNRRDQPHGASPHGGSYGKITWDEAMRLPGSQQLGLGKKLFEQYPWPQFEPHPEWVENRREPALSLEGCQWIWYPEGEPSRDAPAEKRFFRKTFVLPGQKTVARARLRVSADDWFAAHLNGQALGAEGNWKAGRQFDDLARRLRAGTNCVAIMGENKPANVPANPAGLIGCLEVQFTDGEVLKLQSDASWRGAKTGDPGWAAPEFNDSSWVRAKSLGRHGDGPWGPLSETQNEWQVPQATGIPGKVRLIYVPTNQPILVNHLEPAGYQAAYFDPVTGEKRRLGGIRPDAAGQWNCPPPAGIDHDWVLVLE